MAKLQKLNNISKFGLSLLRDFLWERRKVSCIDQNSATLKTLICVFKEYSAALKTLICVFKDYNAHSVMCSEFLYFLHTMLILYHIRTIINGVKSSNAAKYLLLCVTLNYKIRREVPNNVQASFD